MAVLAIKKRQSIRKTILLVSFLLFPFTLYYFSPFLILQGASEGIISASAIVFAFMFISALIFGRAWCAWACPAGGLAEACMIAKDTKVNLRFNWIKWLIWIPWFGGFILVLISAGGIREINPLLGMERGGLAVMEDYWFIIYYIVIGIIVILFFTTGNRGFCHYGCWMAPFMILGRKVRNLAKIPSLELVTSPDKCTDCKQCVRNCPMSLDVNSMVNKGSMENSDCILCGNCVDTCSRGVIHYNFGVKSLAGRVK
jgi:ferredoxin-type protein NapH